MDSKELLRWNVNSFRCPECGEVKITIPHNDWGRTCFGIQKPDPIEEIEELPEFKPSVVSTFPIPKNLEV